MAAVARTRRIDASQKSAAKADDDERSLARHSNLPPDQTDTKMVSEIEGVFGQKDYRMTQHFVDFDLAKLWNTHIQNHKNTVGDQVGHPEDNLQSPQISQ